MPVDVYIPAEGRSHRLADFIISDVNSDAESL